MNPELDIAISVEAGDWPDRVEGLVRKAALAVWDGFEQEGPAELSVLLTDDASIQVLNRDWRGKDKPTNVLSFPGDPSPAPGAPAMLGDIAVAFQTVAREAGEQKKTLDDHLAHMVVHGMLHLLGHDHEDEAEAEEMEALEREFLADLGIADPYPPMEEAIQDAP